MHSETSGEINIAFILSAFGNGHHTAIYG